jgi:hypothetical protein
MKHLSAFLAVLVMFFSGVSFADAPKEPVYAELGTLLDASLDGGVASRTTTVVQTPAFNQIVLYVAFTRGSATSVSATCTANYNLTDTANYEYLGWDCSTSPICLGDQQTWKANVSGNRWWQIPLPWMGRKIKCVFSGVGYNSTDHVVVKALGGVM